MAETLKWLRKRKIELALITNKPERFVAPLLDQMKLGRYFPLIIAGDTLPQQKPDPAALLHVMHMTGVSRNEALFIGDSRNDVLAAKAAGVKCVALSYGYNHGRPIDEEEPALVVDDLRELLPGGCAAHGAALMSPDSQIICLIEEIETCWFPASSGSNEPPCESSRPWPVGAGAPDSILAGPVRRACTPTSFIQEPTRLAPRGRS